MTDHTTPTYTHSSEVSEKARKERQLNEVAEKAQKDIVVNEVAEKAQKDREVIEVAEKTRKDIDVQEVADKAQKGRGRIGKDEAYEVLIDAREPMDRGSSIRSKTNKQLSTLGCGVIVKRSKHIHGEEQNGLFATRCFKKGELVTEVDGEVISPMLTPGSPGTSHFCSIGGGLVINGITIPKEGKGGGSFVNHCDNSDKINVILYKYHSVIGQLREGLSTLDRIALKATRDINKDDELLTNYGRNYFKLCAGTCFNLAFFCSDTC